MPDRDDLAQHLVRLARDLAAEKFAPRAAQYDRAMTFPRENFDDLFRAGLLGAAVPTEYGGHGLGPHRREALGLWMLTRELAKVDLSLARCWESHVNALVMLDGMADARQKARWFEGVVRRGDLWAVWGGEPQSRAPSESTHFGTVVTRAEDGYAVDGTKVFCTGAGAMQWALLMVSTAGPGGVRHTTGPPETQLVLACDLSNPSVVIDLSWWDPIGMRSTCSHLVRFNRTRIPDAQVIGYPGQFLKEAWQTRLIPQYAATFLGAAEGVYEFAREYVRTQGKEGDPFVQQHVGQMAVNVATAELWIRHVAGLWDAGRDEEARSAGLRARHAVEHLAEETFRRAMRACGARCMIRPSALERAYRDFCFYVRHDNDDHLLATIGRAALGEAHDPSFFRPPNA
jgi:alkylation response protein AidB-like acyl-CoA dehydrogenase